MAKGKHKCIRDLAVASKRSLSTCETAWEKTRGAMTEYVDEYLKHNTVGSEWAIIGRQFAAENVRPSEVEALSLKASHWRMLCRSVFEAIKRRQICGRRGSLCTVGPIPSKRKRRQSMESAFGSIGLTTGTAYAYTDSEGEIESVFNSDPEIDIQPEVKSDPEIDIKPEVCSDPEIHTTEPVVKEKSTQTDCFCVNCKKFHFCDH